MYLVELVVVPKILQVSHHRDVPATNVPAVERMTGSKHTSHRRDGGRVPPYNIEVSPPNSLEVSIFFDYMITYSSLLHFLALQYLTVIIPTSIHALQYLTVIIPTSIHE